MLTLRKNRCSARNSSRSRFSGRPAPVQMDRSRALSASARAYSAVSRTMSKFRKGSPPYSRSFLTLPGEDSWKRTRFSTWLREIVSPESLSMKQYSQRSGQAVLIATLKRRISLLQVRLHDAGADIELLEARVRLARVDELGEAFGEGRGDAPEVGQRRVGVAPRDARVGHDADRAEDLL